MRKGPTGPGLRQLGEPRSRRHPWLTSTPSSHSDNSNPATHADRNKVFTRTHKSACVALLCPNVFSSLTNIQRSEQKTSNTSTGKASCASRSLAPSLTPPLATMTHTELKFPLAKPDPRNHEAGQRYVVDLSISSTDQRSFTKNDAATMISLAIKGYQVLREQKISSGADTKSPVLIPFDQTIERLKNLKDW